MSSNNSNSGIGFAGLLALLFIGLKLAGLIDWSWWWVLSPLWIGIPIAFLIILVAIIYVCIENR